MAEAAPRYWAFLSYSHEDARWADWLHKGLEGFAVPARLVGRPIPAGAAPRRFQPIFRDREELGVSADLSERLQSALSQSAYLIVICSPAAARSRWVDEEIRQFKALHGEARVLAVIVAGEPFASFNPDRAEEECFPRALRFRLEADGSAGSILVEPAAADLRAGKDRRRRALLKLISGMLGVDLDELVHRDARRRQQQLGYLTAAVSVAAAAMGVMAVEAFRERDAAVAQRAQAEGLIEFMIGDLRRTLEPAGRLDALDAVGGRALSYYAAQQRQGLDAESLLRRARVLHLLGEIREKRGDLPAAEGFFQEAAKTTGELLQRRPNDPARVFDHAQSVFYLGEIAFRNGEDAAAGQRFAEYRRLAEQLVSIDPHRQDWWAEVDEANTSLGAVLLHDGEADAAADDFTRALTISQSLARADPHNRERQWDLAQTYAWLADSEAFRGRVEAALVDRAAAAAIYKALIARTPSDTEAAVALAANNTAVASLRIAEGALVEAISDLQVAAAEMNKLIAAAPDNSFYKANATPTFLLLAQALLQTGRLEAADALMKTTLPMVTAEARHDQGVAWQGLRLGNARLLDMKIEAEHAQTLGARKAALRPALLEAARLAGLSHKYPRNMPLARVAAEAALLAGDYARLNGGSAQAQVWWRSGMTLAQGAEASLPATDRVRPILRQLSYRLGSAQPPTGGTSVQGPFIKQSAVGEAPRQLSDYRW